MRSKSSLGRQLSLCKVISRCKTRSSKYLKSLKSNKNANQDFYKINCMNKIVDSENERTHCSP